MAREAEVQRERCQIVGVGEFDLISAKATPKGVVIATYEPAEPLLRSTTEEGIR